MQHFLFVPQVCPSRERIRDYSAGQDDQALALAEVFLGRRRDLCTQVAWMGRGCFVEQTGVSALRRRYLVVKGVGPSPGSESMRALLDSLMRARGNGSGGCLRLETESFYPLLVQFVERGGAWNICDPRPEGFSMFNFLCREAEAGAVLRKLGVRAVTPLLLLRNRVEAPWQADNRRSLEGYLRERLPGAVRRHLDLNGQPGRPIRFNSLVYLNMDGGVLIRQALSPYRVANLHQVVVDEDRPGLELLTVHMREVFEVRDDSPDLIGELTSHFTATLAGTAAALLADGILHGQLNVHHQNMTLAAEIADFDEVTFIRSRPGAAEIPFPESKGEALYDAFGANLRRLEKECRIDVSTVLDDDYEEFAGIAYEGIDKPRVAAFLLRQIYDFYSHCVITADMLARNHVENLAQSGSVLAEDSVRSLRSTFMDAFIEGVAREGAMQLLEWCLANGRDYLLRRLLAVEQKRTLYAWGQANEPVDTLIDICSVERAAAIRNEAAGFFELMTRRRRQRCESLFTRASAASRTF